MPDQTIDLPQLIGDILEVRMGVLALAIRTNNSDLAAAMRDSDDKLLMDSLHVEVLAATEDTRRAFDKAYDLSRSLESHIASLEGLNILRGQLDDIKALHARASSVCYRLERVGSQFSRLDITALIELKKNFDGM